MSAREGKELARGDRYSAQRAYCVGVRLGRGGTRATVTFQIGLCFSQVSLDPDDARKFIIGETYILDLSCQADAVYEPVDHTPRSAFPDREAPAWVNRAPRRADVDAFHCPDYDLRLYTRVTPVDRSGRRALWMIEGCVDMHRFVELRAGREGGDVHAIIQEGTVSAEDVNALANCLSTVRWALIDVDETERAFAEAEDAK